MIKKYLESIAATHREANRPYKNRQLGLWLLLASGGTFSVITLVSFYIGFEYHEYLGFLVFGVLQYLFNSVIELWSYGRSLCSETGESVLMEQKEGLVLFLRSFEKEKEDGLDNTWETRLIDILRVKNKAIAIGNPNELFQTLGAPRLYFSNAEWKNEVSDLMSKASLVVMRVGKTEGLMWELAQLKTLCTPDKILIFHPLHEHFDFMDEADYQTFATAASQIFDKPIPPFRYLSKYPIFIQLDDNGAPYILEPDPDFARIEWLFEEVDDQIIKLYSLSVTQPLCKKFDPWATKRYTLAFVLTLLGFSKWFVLVLFLFALAIILLWYLLAALLGI